MKYRRTVNAMGLTGEDLDELVEKAKTAATRRNQS
jgi:hypothetical protein